MFDEIASKSCRCGTQVAAVSPLFNLLTQNLLLHPTLTRDCFDRPVDSERILFAAVIHSSRLLQPFLPRIE